MYRLLDRETAHVRCYADALIEPNEDLSSQIVCRGDVMR